jgi:hypothetical protein
VRDLREDFYWKLRRSIKVLLKPIKLEIGKHHSNIQDRKRLDKICVNREAKEF